MNGPFSAQTAGPVFIAALAITLPACNIEVPDLPGDPRVIEVPVDPEIPVDGVLPPGTRARRRMTIAQLNTSIRQLTGDVGWTEGNPPNERDLFEELSGSLGVPDYEQTTREDLEPSDTFQKFLSDAARSICFKVIDREAGVPPNERVFLIYAGRDDTLENAPERIDQNLSELLMRYHGDEVAVGSTQLERWRWLFETSTFISGDPLDGWRAVCVGLISHPGFYTY